MSVSDLDVLVTDPDELRVMVEEVNEGDLGELEVVVVDPDELRVTVEGEVG